MFRILHLNSNIPTSLSQHGQLFCLQIPERQHKPLLGAKISRKSNTRAHILLGDSDVVPSPSQRDLPVMMDIHQLQKLLRELRLLLNLSPPIQTRNGGESDRSTV
jgi:hypothetical protein